MQMMNNFDGFGGCWLERLRRFDEHTENMGPIDFKNCAFCVYY